MHLDRTRAYAQIVGDTSGRVFEQDGHYFTGSGQLWSAPPEAPEPEGAEAAAPARGSKRKVETKQYADGAKATGPAPLPDTSPVDTQLAAQLEG